MTDPSRAEQNADALVAEVERLRALHTPRPIETAPLVCRILAWWPTIGSWETTYWEPDSGLRPHWDAPSADYWLGYARKKKAQHQPTHWLPMPPAPEVK